MKLRLLALIAVLALPPLVSACGGESAGPDASPSQPKGRVELLGSFPHAENAWTEGLLVSEGVLWESTGLKGKSTVRGIDPQTGDVLWSVPNSEGFFGEGLVRAFGKTYLLTYTEGDAYLFDRAAAQPYTLFAQYDGEGWGLTAAGDYLINSNGSATLYYRDPQTFAITKEVPIRFEGAPVERLNELEFDGTYVWANQWQTPYVYRIREDDPSQVARFTLPPEICPEGTPNGIAWDEEEDAFYLTGQSCAEIWQVRFH
ncbi:MAG TPA: glutaminyl-peptide cyclotransferase [Dehalococcoidia bacterium]|nr:glutaminyl-peptide cyclotransferase [Dehalococcoidia bacterium]